jgi:isoleucyl-tRNA synthetase
LHAISTILFDQPAYKNVISNGLVLDKNGVKMSKRLGNVVDPFETMEKYGADAVRWYIISNSSPWDNLKFDLKGVEDARRKLFGTLFNTYSFFTLYANIDGFVYNENALIPNDQKPELDKWIISKLNTLKKEVGEAFENYEPTLAARAIDEFVDRNLSNWFIRLSRRRFWKNEVGADKQAAYETLYECMVTLSQLMSPIAPFFSDWLYAQLTAPIKEQAVLQDSNLKWDSVHLTHWPAFDASKIDLDLERRMALAQDMSSMILSLRKKEQIKVRQPLQKVLIPILNEAQKQDFLKIEDIIKSEVNIKELEYVEEGSGLFVKSAKANFKILGKKLGKDMAAIAQQIAAFDQEKINVVERNKAIQVGEYEILLEEIEIATSDMPGFLVASENGLTLALDITLSEDLINEGLAREFINKVQNYRKDQDFNVTDKINILITSHDDLKKMIAQFGDYISNEVLAYQISFAEKIENGIEVELNDLKINLLINKI